MLKKEIIRHIFFPNRCDFCGTVINYDVDVCMSCLQNLPVINLSQRCKLCTIERTFCTCKKRRHSFEEAAAPFYYDEVIKDGIIRFKSNQIPDAAKSFAKYMRMAVNICYNDIRFDIITSVPIGARSLKTRGFNQSELLARELSLNLNIRYEELLKKEVIIKEQKYNSARQRKANVFGVFEIIDDALLKDKTILLCDDVITTGSTLDECAFMLRAYGAKAVYCICAAATPKKQKKTE